MNKNQWRYWHETWTTIQAWEIIYDDVTKFYNDFILANYDIILFLPIYKL